MGKSHNLEFLVWNSKLPVGIISQSDWCAKAIDGNLSFVSCSTFKKSAEDNDRIQAISSIMSNSTLLLIKQIKVSSGSPSLLAPIVLTHSICLKRDHEASLSESNSHPPITGRSADKEVMSVLSKNLRCEKIGGDIVNGDVARSVILSSSILRKDILGNSCMSWDTVSPFPGQEYHCLQLLLPRSSRSWLSSWSYESRNVH